MDRVFKLHQDFIFLNHKEAEAYNENKIISVLSYVFIFIIMLRLLLINRKEDGRNKEELLIYILLIIYIFFAAGPNRPLGIFYEYWVINNNLLAFLRTTAGAVFYMSIFYALLIFSFVIHFRKVRFIMFSIIMVGILYVGYPFLNGEYYQNFNNINKWTNRKDHGFKIPGEYYDLKDIIDSQKIVARTFYPNSDLTYINTKWGFFGPIIYNFIYNNYNLGYNKIFSNPGNHNVGFVFLDSSLTDKIRYKLDNKILLHDRGFIKYFAVALDDFYPFHLSKSYAVAV